MAEKTVLTSKASLRILDDPGIHLRIRKEFATGCYRAIDSVFHNHTYTYLLRWQVDMTFCLIASRPPRKLVYVWIIRLEGMGEAERDPPGDQGMLGRVFWQDG